MIKEFIIKKNVKLFSFNFIIITISLVLSVFAIPLKNLFNFNFNYIDDILATYLLGVIIYNLVRGLYKFDKTDIIILYATVIIDIIAFLGNYISKFQSSFIGIMVDYLAWHKLVITYIAYKTIIKEKKVDYYYYILEMISKIIIVISCILEVLNLFNIINLSPENSRYGINAFSIMGHPSTTCAIIAFIICCLANKPRKNFAWIIISFALEIATLRMKAFGFVAAFILTYACTRDNKKIVLKFSMIILVLVGVAASSIKFYFVDKEASRAQLLNASIEISKDMFPLGSGFASFGSQMSGKFYSDAYIEYNLSNRYGFSKQNNSFIGDGGWATLIAQFGYIGTILFIFILVCIIKDVIGKQTKLDILFPLIGLIEYLLISSTNEPAINNSYIIVYTLFFALFRTKNYLKLKGEHNEI